MIGSVEWVWSSGFAAISLPALTPGHQGTHRTPSLPPGHRWARLIQSLCGEIKVKCDTIKQFVLSAVIVIITLLGITQSGASTMGKCCDITIVQSYLFHWSLSETHLLNISHLIWFFLPKNFPNWSYLKYSPIVRSIGQWSHSAAAGRGRVKYCSITLLDIRH